MRRDVFIEMILRQIYNGQPNDDSTITRNLVNVWLEPAIAAAAKANFNDNIKLDGIAYVNGSFYSTFKGIAITNDEYGLWKITLPEIPIGIGHNNGISTLQIKENTSNISLPVIWINEAQRSFYQGMRTIPDKILAYSQGEFVYLICTYLLNEFTATVSMVSGGDSTDMDSVINVPPDYLPVMIEFLKNQLMFERSAPKDAVNDGQDAINFA